MCYNTLMARFTRRQSQESDPRPSAQPSQEGNFAWSFGPDDATGGPVDPDAAGGPVIEHQPRFGRNRGEAGLHSPFQGAEGRRRAAALARELDAAQERWWSNGQLPPQPLLRDGLLALQAGHPLGEGQRTLLLRTALARGKGMITALAHQSDPERTADVLADALLDPRPRLQGGSLPAEEVRRLRQEDPRGAAWGARLLQVLRTETTLPLEPRRSHAAQILAQLQARPVTAAPPAPAYPVPLAQDPLAAPAPYGPMRAGRPARRRGPRLWTGLLAVLALLLLGAAAVVAWQGGPIQPNPDQITVPAGIYPISDPAQPGQERRVQVAAFRIDRTEVTNAAYRRCREAGVCPMPAGTSLGQPVGAGANSVLDPAKQSLPVTGVSWGAANAYCTWAGMRLPLEEEWEVAAAVTPNSLRRLTFPWGDQFRSSVVNGARGTGEPAPQPVRTFSPGGDSPFGAAEMAGNVAEWTATLLESGVFVVKGGSYLDDVPGLRTDSWQAISAETAAPWLGFRCAVTGSGR